jgi:shikimate kinase
MMDYSHVVKRIRNNVSSSGTNEKHTRLLTFSDKQIIWKHWEQSFYWDRSVNPVRLHPYLHEEHIHLNTQTKMRNHLAEQVLDHDMLNLMRHYRSSKGQEGACLDSSISLLEQTSKLVAFFRDSRPLTSTTDDRLHTLQDVLSWFLDWEIQVRATGGTTVEQNKKLISHETRDDIVCLIRGFLELVNRRLQASKRSIIPAGINSDIVENMFSQQRAAYHGANTNPSVYQYKQGLNASILGVRTVSKKSNAAPSKHSAVPFNFTVNTPLNPRCPMANITNR